MRSIEATLAAATVLFVAFANGCASQASRPNPGPQAAPPAAAPAPGNLPAVPPYQPLPPSGPSLPPVDLDEEVVVSVGTTFVTYHSAPGACGTVRMTVTAIKGHELAVHHTYQTPPYTAPLPKGMELQLKTPQSEDGSPPPIEDVEVPAGKFRCYRTHSITPAQNGNGSIDATTWTSVDFPVTIRSISTWNGSLNHNDLIRIENATTRPRESAGPGPPAQQASPTAASPAAASPAAAPPAAAPGAAGTCPSCGAKVTSGARFCASCGARLDGGPVEKKDEPKRNEF
jgi:hypothetical protein